MNPDAVSKQRPPVRRGKPELRASPEAAATSRLLALSAAKDRYAPSTRVTDTASRRPSIVLAGIAAMVVAAALILAGRFEHVCQGTVRIGGSSSPERVAVHRKELLDYAWDRMAAVGREGARSGAWFVDSPDASLLRFCVTTSRRRDGVDLARRIAMGFCARMREVADAARITPTPAEDVLSQYVAHLQERLNEAQSQMDAAIATLPPTDPSEHRGAMLERWQALRSDFDAARNQLAEASDRATRLEAEPTPTHGPVSAEQRQAALAADAALQQDLRELTVNLAELKARLLDVWQQSAGPLEQLTLAVGELRQVVSAPRSTDRASGPTDRAARSAGSTNAPAMTIEPYAAAVETFATAWNREFMALQQLPADPYTGEVLDVYHRSRRQLNDFLYATARELASMRAQLRSVVGDPVDTARQHVFQSNLIRAFEAAQAAHHRFEFAAGAIETPGNFHLDAAFRSASGLRRRSQDRIQDIEEALQTAAAERARKRRIQDLAEAETLVEQVRTAADQTVDELLALQQELNLNAETSEAFLRAVLKAEIATARLKLTQDDLSTTEERLHRLEAERSVAAEDTHIEFVSAGVVGRPVNLGERVRMGAIAGVLTLVLVLAAQWWIARRGQP